MEKNQNILWAGEHWIAYLNSVDENNNSSSVGIYHTRFCPAGEGNVALINIPGKDGITAAITDNRGVYDFNMSHVRAAPPDAPFNNIDFQVIEGTFTRIGDVRTNPGWKINFGDSSVVATWDSLVKPFVMNGREPNPRGIAVAFSVLIFADDGSITFNGKRSSGKPYTREGWRRITGPEGPASSFCFALSETYTVE